MTVLDTSAAIDYLLDADDGGQVGEIVRSNAGAAAPDVLVFEVLAVLRRHTLRGEIHQDRAEAALEHLETVPIDWFASMPLRGRAWSLRANLTPADALFVALAERLGEPLATKDGALASSAPLHASVEVELLS